MWRGSELMNIVEDGRGCFDADRNGEKLLGLIPKPQPPDLDKILVWTKFADLVIPEKPISNGSSNGHGEVGRLVEHPLYVTSSINGSSNGHLEGPRLIEQLLSDTSATTIDNGLLSGHRGAREIFTYYDVVTCMPTRKVIYQNGKFVKEKKYPNPKPKKKQKKG